MEFKSIKEVFEYAINREQEAADFYFYLAKQMHKSEMRIMFESIANEELGHKLRLQYIMKNNLHIKIEESVLHLFKQTDYMPDEPKVHDLELKDAISLAIKRENFSYTLYKDLATATDERDLHAILMDLSRDEAEHMRKFESELEEFFSK
jgi:rubrerythrin